jgi:hypothetical protein
MGYAGIPVLETPAEALAEWAEGTRVRVGTEGTVEAA